MWGCHHERRHGHIWCQELQLQGGSLWGVTGTLTQGSYIFSYERKYEYHVRNTFNAMQCSAVQCSAVQCSAVQCSAVQRSAMQCGAVQLSKIKQCKLMRLTTRILYLHKCLSAERTCPACTYMSLLLLTMPITDLRIWTPKHDLS